MHAAFNSLLEAIVDRSFVRVKRIMHDYAAGSDERFNELASHRLPANLMAPTHIAARNGLIDMAYYLCPSIMEDGEGVRWELLHDAEGKTAWHYFAEAGNLEAINFLSDRDGSFREMCIDAVDRNGNTMMHLAAQNGHAEVVKALIKLGAARRVLNSEGETPLHCAASSGSLETVKAILEAPKTWAQVFSSFYRSIRDPLLDHTDIHGNTVLHSAAKGDSAAVITYLIKEKGMDLKAKNVLNNAALTLAVLYGKTHSAAALFDCGADIAVAKEAVTPAKRASMAADVNVVPVEQSISTIKKARASIRMPAVNQFYKNHESPSAD